MDEGKGRGDKGIERGGERRGEVGLGKEEKGG